MRLLGLIAAQIVYGSLYPWTFRRAGLAPSFWPTDWHRLDWSDIAANLLIYLPVGLFGLAAADRRGWRRVRWFAPILFAFSLSLAMELSQTYIVGRVPSVLDLIANTAGAMIGVLAGWLFRDSLNGETFLAFYWIGLQAATVIGVFLGRPYPQFWTSPVELLTTLSGWAVFFRLLSDPPARTRLAQSAAAAFSLLLLIRGLSPFQFVAYPHATSWVPLAALLNTPWLAALPIFFEKSFLYGSAIWLIRHAGVRLSAATLTVATLLAAIEAVQRYLPGRTSETTDPFLALVLGAALSFAGSVNERSKGLTLP